jgi:GntR family transcriptional regulator
MIITIDFESDIPIYTQLRNEIVSGIAKGDLIEGDSLPSVRQLGDDIGVNLHTVNKAYNILKQEGFVKIDRRKGAIISVSLDGSKDVSISSLEKELEPITATAFCKHVSKEEFISIVDKLFESYSKEE